MIQSLTLKIDHLYVSTISSSIRTHENNLNIGHNYDEVNPLLKFYE